MVNLQFYFTKTNFVNLLQLFLELKMKVINFAALVQIYEDISRSQANPMSYYYKQNNPIKLPYINFEVRNLFGCNLCGKTELGQLILFYVQP